MRTYLHAEAFMLMTYRADDGEEERIWNSRDGVTPFIITLRSGKEARHVDWQSDAFMGENWSPPPGSRVFVDLTPERARESARQRVERYWDHPEYPMSGSGRTKDEWVDVLAADYRPGEPSLVEVPG